MWGHAMNDKEAIMSMDMMLMKSEQLAKMMGHDDFKAFCDGWLDYSSEQV